MTIFLRLVKSDNPEKKYRVDLEGDSGREKSIYFGDSHSKDYTRFNALEREEHKRRYIQRHKAREDWTQSGVETSGFWAKHILWNKPTVAASLKDTLARFNLS